MWILTSDIWNLQSAVLQTLVKCKITNHLELWRSNIKRQSETFKIGFPCMLGVAFVAETYRTCWWYLFVEPLLHRAPGPKYSAPRQLRIGNFKYDKSNDEIGHLQSEPLQTTHLKHSHYSKHVARIWSNIDIIWTFEIWKFKYITS